MKKRLIVILATLMCISLCACGGNESTSGDNANTQVENNSGSNTDTKTEEKEIEITVDNWQEYFEFKEIILPYNTYNAFDELESENITVDYCLVLKDKYEVDIEKSKVVIEITGYYETWSINADMNTLSITYIEPIGTKNDFNRINEFEQIFRNNEQLKGVVYYGLQVSPLGEPNATHFNEETQIRTALRCVIEEVNRIEGTIYVKETDTREEIVDSSNLTVEEMQTYYDVEKYIGTPRIEKLKVGNYNNDSEYILMSNFEEVGNIKEYEIAVDNRLGVYKKYDCIITDNNTPNDWKDDVVVYIFIQ